MKSRRFYRRIPARLSQLLVILTVSLSTDSVVPAQSQGAWPPITPEELALEDNPDAPGSKALILLKKDFRDDVENVREVYYRIKILSEEGRKYADVEIPYSENQKVGIVAARTVQPDGRIIGFRGAIFDKSLVRGKKTSLMTKTFTMPEVQVGSIIEYRFRIETEEDQGYITTFFIQERLFTREAHLRLRPQDIEGWRIVRHLVPTSGNSGWYRHGDIHQVVLRKIPALEEEAFMLPRLQRLMRYDIVYFSDWSRLGWLVANFISDFIGKPKKLKPAVKRLTSPSDNFRVKLEKLYDAVQAKVRNLSYEESYSKKERKREKLKERKSARDVWKYGYGTAEEITRLFVGLCRAAGFTADIVLTSQRDTHFFDSRLPHLSQLDGEIALIELGDEFLYLDPGTRFAPFGWVSWENQGVIGYRMNEDRISEGQTPLLEPGKNARNREAIVEMQPDGSARVQLNVSYSGGEAVELRNDLFEFSEEQRRERFHGALESQGFEKVSDIRWEGLDDASHDVEVFSTFEIPNTQSSEASRIVIQPVLFPVRSPFGRWRRKMSVYLPEAYGRVERIRIIPPPGYELEFGAGQPHVSNAFGDYEAALEEEQDVWIYTRSLNVNTLSIPAKEYRELKQFFDLVSARDRLCLVFKRGVEDEQ